MPSAASSRTSDAANDNDARGTNNAEAATDKMSGPLLALYARLGAWKRQAPHLYTSCQTQMLEWPALALEWLPDRRNTKFDDFALHYVAVGTQALPGSLNYISVVEAAVPVDMEELADYLHGEEGDAAAGGATYTNVKGHSRLVQLVPVDGIVHKIRSNPKAPDVLAVVTSATGDIQIHQLSTRPPFSAEPADNTCNFRLSAGKIPRSPGFALEWNPVEAGTIVSGADDGTLYLWDIAGPLEMLFDEEFASGGLRSQEAVRPLSKLNGHKDIIHDVACHPIHANVVATACQDGTAALWDTRVLTTTTSTLRNAHAGGAFGVDFHPSAVSCLTTCGADGVVALWDVRNTEAPVVELMFHTAGVAGVQWAPFSDSALLSYGLDGNVCLWDLERTGMNAGGNGDKDAPPELAFVHAGHLSRVTEARWCPNLDDEWLVASTDANNMLQIFRPTKHTIDEHRSAEAFDADLEEK